MSEKTFEQLLEEWREIKRDLAYHFVKGLGIIWLVKKIPFLELKDWVKEREEKNKEKTNDT